MGILVGTGLVFVVIRYLTLLRQWITEDKLGKKGKLSRKNLHMKQSSFGGESRVGEVQMESMNTKGVSHEIGRHDNSV